jgi:hypothetical protein
MMGVRRAVNRWWPAAGLVAVALGLFHEALFTEKVFFERDLSLLWYPRVASMVRAVGEGAWPLWDPYPAFGVSAVADANYQLFYPPTWLNLILPPELFLKAFTLTHALWAALGMMRLATRVGLARVPAAVAGAGWMASGPFLSLASHHHLASAAWMPWVLWAFLGALERTTWRSAVLLASCAAAQLLGGSADMCHLTAWLAVVFALAVVEPSGVRPRLGSLRSLGLLLGAAGLTVCLAAPQWLPTIVQMRGSNRSAYEPQMNMYWSLHPVALVDAVVPRLVSDAPVSAELRQRLSEGREAYLNSIYLGVATFPLALLGLVAVRRRLGLALGAGVAFLGIASLGRHACVYPLFLKLPVVGLFRYPAKWMVAASLLWALLVGLGIGVCQEEQRARSRRALWLASGLAGLLGALALFGAWRVSGAGESLGCWLWADLDTWARAAAIAVAGRRLLVAGVASVVAAALLLALRVISRPRWLWTSGLVVVALGDLAVAGSRVNAVGPPALLTHRPPILDRLDLDLDEYRVYPAPAPDRQPKALLAHGPRGWTPAWAWALGQIEAIRPMTSGRWRLYGSFEGDPTGLADANVPTVTRVATLAPAGGVLLRVLQMWNVRYVIGVEQQRFAFLQRVGEWPSVASRPLCLWRVPDPLPRAYVVGGARYARGLDSVRTVLDPAFEPTREIVVEEEAAVRPAGQDFQGAARTVSRRSDRVEIESVANGAGYAVLVDAYDPGWTAAVDGRPARILRANLVCRAVAVPPGRHTVAFTYRPRSVVWGLALGVLGVGIILASVVTWAGLRRAGQRSVSS